MPQHPQFLPPILSLNGTWDEALDVLYSIFETDFKKHISNHEGIHITFNKNIVPDGNGKEEGFWHVISKVDYQTGDRLPDFARAKRLPWARPLMESSATTEIKVFDYYEGTKDKGIRRYIWLEDFDYVLVLQRRGNGYFWITAFFVTKGKKRNLSKKYIGRET